MAASKLKVLSYVHLRNIHGSTGAGRVARQMVEHLADRPGVELRVLADPKDHERIAPLAGIPWTEFNYHFFKRDTSLQQAQWLMTDYPRAESYWPQTDLMYCTAESYVPTKRCPLAVTLHDAAIFEPGALPRDGARLQQRIKWTILYRKLARAAELLLTPSEFSAERLAHYIPGIQGRLRVVPNGVPARFFEPVSPAGEAFLEAHGLRTTPYILVPGGLHFRKNADLILDVWPTLRASLGGAKLVVAGHNTPGYKERAAALGDSIHLTGFVDDEALRSLYGAARLVWFPTRYEGFGIPPLEAMASGAPVVTTRTASVPEVVGTAAVLVSMDDRGEHAEVIRGLFNDSARLHDLARCGEHRAAQFTWPSAAEKLEQCFYGAC